MMHGLKRIARSCCIAGGIGVIGYGLTLSAIGTQSRWLACLASGGVLLAIGLWPRFDGAEPEENRAIVNVVSSLSLIFALLAIQLARVQLLSNRAISAQTGTDPVTGDAFSNIRTVNQSLRGVRGSIVDRSGVVLAQSKRQQGKLERDYPVDTASYVSGFFSPLKYGLDGLEKSFDDELSGRSTASPFAREIDQLLDRQPRGATIRLTIDSDLHAKAHELLGDRIGAVVLLEVATGAVRTLASNPHYDPNQLIALDADSAQSATDYWNQLIVDPTQPLLVRATQGLYTPGSTFKTVTLSAALETGTAKPSDVYQDDGGLNVDGHIIVEANRPDDSISWTLEEGLAFSLNVVFAQVGLQLGAEILRDYAGRFGFGQRIPFDIPVATGQITSTADFLDAPAAVADTAFGQGQLLTTPLGMALVAAAIANDGDMMRPYLVDSVTDSDGHQMHKADPKVWRRPIDRTTASTVRDLMVNTVVNGYAFKAAIDGLLVGGKTGTAETGQAEPHAWFIGFAGDPDPAFAVAVVLEHGGTATAGPVSIAREMLSTAMFGDA